MQHAAAVVAGGSRRHRLRDWPCPRLLASDIDGDRLTFTVTAPAGGMFDLDAAAGSFVYRPGVDFAGTEQLVATASAAGVSVTAPLTLDVRAVDFSGEWKATAVRVDDNGQSNGCADLTWPITFDTNFGKPAVHFRVLFSCQSIELDLTATPPLDGPTVSRIRAHQEGIELAIEPDTSTHAYRFRLLQVSFGKTFVFTGALRRL